MLDYLCGSTFAPVEFREKSSNFYSFPVAEKIGFSNVNYGIEQCPFGASFNTNESFKIPPKKYFFETKFYEAGKIWAGFLAKLGPNLLTYC